MIPFAALLMVASATPPEARPRVPRITDDPFDRPAAPSPRTPPRRVELARHSPPPVLSPDDHAKIAAAAEKRARRAAKRLGVTRG